MVALKRKRVTTRRPPTRRSRNAVVALKPPMERGIAQIRLQSRNAVVALKLRYGFSSPRPPSRKQERRGGIETWFKGRKYTTP